VPSLGVYFLSLTLSVCLSVSPSVTLLLQIASFLFLDGIDFNRAIFRPSLLHVALYKTVFFDFWFRPLTPKIHSPKFYRPVYWCCPRANWYTHVCDGSNGQSVHTKTCMWGWSLLQWQRHFRYARSLIAYRLVNLCPGIIIMKVEHKIHKRLLRTK